jgi:hypothetical protein
MALQPRTIQKLFREDFPGTNPWIVSSSERAKLRTDLKALLKRFDGVETQDHGYVREEEKERFVASFSILDPCSYYYSGMRETFRLLLDHAKRLVIQDGHSVPVAFVSNLEEIEKFVRHCKQRLDRRKALKVKRGKVRDLVAQAILAQVRKLAKEERFDFMSESDEHKLKLFVRLSENHAVEVQVPFKDFQRFLPQLRTAIISLRELHQSGIRFHLVVGRSLPRRKEWITYRSLKD